MRYSRFAVFSLLVVAFALQGISSVYAARIAVLPWKHLGAESIAGQEVALALQIGFRHDFQVEVISPEDLDAAMQRLGLRIDDHWTEGDAVQFMEILSADFLVFGNLIHDTTQTSGSLLVLKNTRNGKTDVLVKKRISVGQIQQKPLVRLRHFVQTIYSSLQPFLTKKRSSYSFQAMDQRNLDFVWILEYKGAMAYEIGRMRESMEIFWNRYQTTFPGSRLRFAVIPVSSQGRPASRFLDFTSSKKEWRRFLDSMRSIPVSQGGSFSESIAYLFKKVSWSSSLKAAYCWTNGGLLPGFTSLGATSARLQQERILFFSGLLPGAGKADESYFRALSENSGGSYQFVATFMEGYSASERFQVGGWGGHWFRYSGQNSRFTATLFPEFTEFIRRWQLQSGQLEQDSSVWKYLGYSSVASPNVLFQYISKRFGQVRPNPNFSVLHNIAILPWQQVSGWMNYHLPGLAIPGITRKFLLKDGTLTKWISIPESRTEIVAALRQARQKKMQMTLAATWVKNLSDVQGYSLLPDSLQIFPWDFKAPQIYLLTLQDPIQDRTLSGGLGFGRLWFFQVHVMDEQSGAGSDVRDD